MKLNLQRQSFGLATGDRQYKKEFLRYTARVPRLFHKCSNDFYLP